MTTPTRAANILGELTAEADDVMLKGAFFESTNYRALVQETDFRFVVGRRGTGKSALFRKLSETLGIQRGVLLVTNRPPEEKVTVFRHELRKFTTNYDQIRMLTKLTWKVQVLTQALDEILKDYKAGRLDDREELELLSTAT